MFILFVDVNVTTGHEFLWKMRHIILMQTSQTQFIKYNHYNTVRSDYKKENGHRLKPISVTLHVHPLSNFPKEYTEKILKCTVCVSILESELTCADLHDQHSNSSEDGPYLGHWRHESSVHVSYIAAGTASLP